MMDEALSRRVREALYRARRAAFDERAAAVRVSEQKTERERDRERERERQSTALGEEQNHGTERCP